MTSSQGAIVKQDADYRRIVEILMACGRDMLASRGIATEITEWQGGAESAESVVAVIGYGGATLRGAVLLQCTVDVATSLLPEGMADPEVGTDVLCDAMGEHSNQILGRLKNRLFTGGVDLRLAIPATAVARNLRLGAPPNARSTTHALSTPRGPLLVRLDAVFAPRFTLGPVDETLPHDMLAEGEMLMF
jgi:CheY-specific phosphatase CheX